MDTFKKEITQEEREVIVTARFSIWLRNHFIHTLSGWVNIYDSPQHYGFSNNVHKSRTVEQLFELFKKTEEYCSIPDATKMVYVHGPNEMTQICTSFHCWMKENDTEEQAENWANFTDEDMFNFFIQNFYKR